ncbi:MAG: ribonuclease P protein component [Candidatus Omnitrophota bacterium]
MKHLRKSAEFADILRNGGKIKEKTITVFYQKTGLPGSLTPGIIVSKRTEPLATRRNYIRRTIYAVCREAALLFEKNTEVVVRVDGKATCRGRRDLRETLKKDLEAALAKIRTQEK